MPTTRLDLVLCCEGGKESELTSAIRRKLVTEDDPPLPQRFLVAATTFSFNGSRGMIARCLEAPSDFVTLLPGQVGREIATVAGRILHREIAMSRLKEDVTGLTGVSSQSAEGRGGQHLQ